MQKRLLLCLMAALLSGVFGLPAAAGEAKWPEGSGDGKKSNGKMTLDVTNVSEGYFMAAVSEKTSHRLKLRVSKDGKTLSYDLNSDGDFEVFPLQLGSGKYDISLYENVSGKSFSGAGKISVEVALSREDGAFLYPNQYVNYTELTKAVAAANEMCAGKSEKEIFSLVQAYVVENYAYDYIKSLTVTPSEVPDIDGCYEKKMGMCHDLSALMVCMLRSQGIPARLTLGYADKNYHAWTVTPVESTDVLFDPAAALDAIGKPGTYTAERSY